MARPLHSLAAMLRPRPNVAHATSAPRVPLAVALALLACACGSSHGPGDAAGPGDGGARDAARPRDAGGPIDAGPRGACAPDDARAQTCPELLCDGPGTWHWSGDRCFWIDCGACEGADCARGFGAEVNCLAAHATCDAALCRDSGGAWLWWAEECGHYECGVPPPAICESPMPVCDCGPHRRFVPSIGCSDDTSCPIAEPIARDELCVATGGSWDGSCCDSVCGEPCADACVAPACNCGLFEIFDDARGCIDHPMCHERRRGQTCHAPARCESGTICCERCGGAGCMGPPTCQYPVCDDDPTRDECGNDLLAP